MKIEYVSVAEQAHSLGPAYSNPEGTSCTDVEGWVPQYRHSTATERLRTMVLLFIVWSTSTQGVAISNWMRNTLPVV